MKSESRRQQKMASLLQETLSLILPEELRPFTASLVTITRVEVQGDLRAARVLLSVFGPASPEDVRTHLTKRTGAIRHRLASLVEFKYNPGLFFVLDPSAEAVERIERIIAETQHDDETG